MFQVNNYVLSFIAACVVYAGLVMYHNKKKEETTWFHPESAMYASATGAIGLAISYFLLRNKTAYSSNMNNTMGASAILTNRPVNNRANGNTKLNAQSMNSNRAVLDTGSVVGATGEFVDPTPYK